MQLYQNLSKKSGVKEFEIGSDYINIKMKNGMIYRYTYIVPGKNEVEAMKLFAKQGKGLNSFLDKTVKGKYYSIVTETQEDISEVIGKLKKEILNLKFGDKINLEFRNLLSEIQIWVNGEIKNENINEKEIFDIVYALENNVSELNKNTNTEYDKEKIKLQTHKYFNELKEKFKFNTVKEKFTNNKKLLKTDHMKEKIKKLNNRLVQYEKILDNYQKEFIDKYTIRSEERTKFIQSNTDKYMKFIDEKIDTIILRDKDIKRKFDEIKTKQSDLKEKICTELKLLMGNIQNEELAYYFQYESKKLKGEVSFTSITGFIAGLMTPYWVWLIATLLGMIAIACFAGNIFFYENSTDWRVMLHRLPLFSILIWFTWFCSKQFSYTKQICDEYEYKYALSKSYLSYRSEAIKLEDSTKVDALLITLLDAVIKNIATSPVQSVKMDCHTPFSEVFGSIKDVVKNEKGNKS